MAGESWEGFRGKASLAGYCEAAHPLDSRRPKGAGGRSPLPSSPSALGPEGLWGAVWG